MPAIFKAEYPIAGLKGADYNPRKISPEAVEELKRSLDTLGVAKPVIISKDLIIAGHQRTKSLRALGRKTVPVIILGDVTKTDEVRFNQLHNGTDMDLGDEAVDVGTSDCQPFHFEEIPAKKVKGNLRAGMAEIRLFIGDLLLRYGNWGCCVATMSGRVIHAAQYALACLPMNYPVRVYRIPDELEKTACEFLGKTYGVYSYDHIQRNTYVQTLAQMFRLRNSNSQFDREGLQSRLYENLVIPSLKKTERVLDFGCGQADYVKFLSKAGYQIKGIEFFFRNGGMIDTVKVHEMIDRAADDLKKNGLFDVVVCDSVLNSVDTVQAESDVMTSVNALAKPGARIYLSGRPDLCKEVLAKGTQRGGQKLRRSFEFLDENKLSGTYRNGHWFFQKLHSDEDVKKLAEKYIGKLKTYKVNGTTSWSCWCKKEFELDAAAVEAALTREFNLPWPAGKTVGRAEQILEAWRAAV